MATATQKDNQVTNVVIAGIGGQGVLKASDILARTVFSTGFDVKKSEIHGMSQRGGSVTSDVRFGPEVLSPMVPTGQADFLVVVSADQIENNRHLLAEQGALIGPDSIDQAQLPNKRSINVALLGALSTHLDIDTEKWLESIRAAFASKLHDINEKAFQVGRDTYKK